MSLFGMFLREHLKTTPKAEFLKAFLLSHFSPMFYFYTSLKTSESLSGGIEMEHWAKMGSTDGFII